MKLTTYVIIFTTGLTSAPIAVDGKPDGSLRARGGQSKEPLRAKGRQTLFKEVQATCLQGQSFELDVVVEEGPDKYTQCKNAFMDKIAEEMEGVAGCATRGNPVVSELKNLLGSNAIGMVNEACANARTDQESTTFNEIFAESDRPLGVKEYYDGNTFLNEEIGSLVEDGAFIEETYENTAQDSLIDFPENVYNFDECNLNAVMCCFVQDRQPNDGNGNCQEPLETDCIDADPADNTDICYVDMARSPRSNHVEGGFALYHHLTDEDNGEAETEGRAHCHGFAWKNSNQSPSNRYRGNNLFYVSLYDHLYTRGYVRDTPGAPMCGCIEKMPVVTRSDCTEMEVTETYTFSYDHVTETLSASITEVTINYQACQGLNNQNNDLRAYYDKLVEDEDANISVEDQEEFHQHVVGNNQCAAAIDTFMASKGWAEVVA